MVGASDGYDSLQRIAAAEKLDPFRGGSSARLAECEVTLSARGVWDATSKMEESAALARPIYCLLSMFPARFRDPERS